MTLPIAALSDADRRRFPRLPLDHPVDLVDLDGGARFTGRARGLSGGGLRFACDEPLSPGMRLSITLTPPLTVTQPLKAELEVLRCDAEGPGYEVAGHFVRLLG